MGCGQVKVGGQERPTLGAWGGVERAWPTGNGAGKPPLLSRLPPSLTHSLTHWHIQRTALRPVLNQAEAVCAFKGLYSETFKFGGHKQADVTLIGEGQ